jgi:small-conductance mechanosensitive channel/CRP-like cAMP-binding protein
MDEYLDLLTESNFAFGRAGVASAAILVLALWMLLPRAIRRKARLPTVLLGLHVSLMLAHKLARAGAPVRHTLEVAGLCGLLLCLGRSAYLLIVEWLLSHRLKRPLARIFGDIVQVAIYFSVAFVTFHEMGAEFGSLLTTSALLTAVVGLSLQETLGNLFAGLAIQAQRTFQIGDWIQVEGTPDSSFGRVVEINWRATKIQTYDSVEIVFPNAFLAKSPIRNFTKPTSLSRRLIRLHGGYQVAPHRMETALLEAAKGCPGVLENPAPRVWIGEFDPHGIEYKLLYFIDDFDHTPAIDPAVRQRIWYSLQRAGIGLPYPIRDVRLQQVSETGAWQAELDQAKRRQRMLRTVDFLDVLPEHALGHLAQNSRTCLYAAGEEIIREGEEGSELFVIRSGEATVRIAREARESVEVARLGAGSVFGEMSLVTGERRSATVRTTSACEVIVLGRDAFREVLEENPDLAHRVSEVLASRQAEIEQAQSAGDGLDRETRSGVLLAKIRALFSLWPGAGASDEAED